MKRLGVPRRSLSQAGEIKWQDPSFHNTMSQAQINRWSDTEQRKKQAEILKARWESGCCGWHNEEWRNKMSETTEASWAKGDYDGVFDSTSQIHKQVANALDMLGIEHITEYRIPGTRWHYDECIPSATLLVEIDGVFWHHSDWAVERGVPQRDKMKTELAQCLGYNLIRFTDMEIEGIGVYKFVATKLLPFIENDKSYNPTNALYHLPLFRHLDETRG
jgi:very-short-patch-repair endonuclease